MLYTALKPVIGIALTWYYRSFLVSGRSRIPNTGPVFLAVNHPNAMVDALSVAWAVPRPVRFTAKATIFANPIVAKFLRALGVVPLKRVSDEAKKAVEAGAVIDPERNVESFRAVCEALAQGSAIVIFPEGKSHDSPQLAPLRTGLARMALMARDTFGVRGIQIVPIGLLFERKEEPRSRVLVQVGDAIHLDMFPASETAVDALTRLVTERLAAVTLNFETPEDANRIASVSGTLAALIEPPTSVGEAGPSLSTTLAVIRRAERVQKALSSDVSQSPESATLQARVQHFEEREELFRARLAHEHVPIADLAIDLDNTAGARFAIREFLIALLLVPVSVWGRLTHFVPLRLARWLALRGARNRDEPAMNTMLFGVALVLAAYAVQTAVVWWFFGPWWALVFVATLIPSASSDLRYGDRARRRSQRMRTFLRFRKQPALQRELLIEADWLRHEAGAIELSV